MKELIALHTHWVTADAVKHFVGTRVPVTHEPDGIPAQAMEHAQQYSMFLRLFVWYALVFVVVEGYRDLRLHDVEVDRLLADDEKVDALRRFRNAVFHYQENPLGPKLMAFLSINESELWVGQLHSAFKSFFERTFPIEQLLSNEHQRKA